MSTTQSWAQESGIFFTPGIEITQARIGGLEHLVWFDEAAQRVVKTTYGGCFGRTVRRIQAGLAPASPIEYLRRWSLHNHLFGAITSIVGVTNLRDDSLAITVSQQVLAGDLPTDPQIATFMSQSGFQPILDQLFAWYRNHDAIAIFDARPANFVLVEDSPIPFDLIPVVLSQR